MKQYEYAIEYVHEDVRSGKSTMRMPDYEEAMDMAKWLHERGATEVKILRRSISDWKPIHQSGIPGGIEFGS